MKRSIDVCTHSVHCRIINELRGSAISMMIFYAAATDDVGGRIPRGQPQAVSGRAVNSTALVVSWLAPAATSRWVTGYRVVVSPARLDADRASVPRSVPVETLVPAGGPHPTRRTTAVVAGLDKFTPYTIAVAAFSVRGSGPFSDAIVVQTEEDGTTSRDLNSRMRIS